MNARRLYLGILAVALSFGSASAMGQITFTFTQLDPPGSVSTEADDINSQGQIIGSFLTQRAGSTAGSSRTARSRKLIFPAPAQRAPSTSTTPA